MEEERPASVFLALKYPHLGPKEVAIWETFLRKTKLKFIRLEYDVRVGKAKIPSWYIEQYKVLKEEVKRRPELKFELRIKGAVIKMFDALTKLRIDVVGETKDHIWIFEVKPRAGRSALGQLLAYAWWYERQFKPRKPIKLAVVCEEVDTNLLPLFDLYKIHVFKVTEM